MKRKMIAAVTASVLALGLIVAGTLAYLTAQADPVTNTFTVGNIAIDLDEPLFDAEYPTGTAKLYPGVVIAKDPTVTVEKGSEKSFVYMLMDNQLNFKAGLNDTEDTISLNLHANWIPIQTVGTMTLFRYHVPVDQSAAALDLRLTPLFTTVTVHSTLVTSSNIHNLDGKTIEIKAYAHQFATVSQANADAAARTHFGLPSVP